MKLRLTVKEGLKILFEVEGKELDDRAITLADLNKVIELEQTLEKYFGLRFHITQVN